ncbi:MAG: DUF488 family protein [Limisphaerales bacterium]
MLFERQKLLLTLSDAIGEPVGDADFQKLLFLYTQEGEAAPSYDVVPDKVGAFETIRGWVAAGERVALTCFERLPQHCHRHCVAEALERMGGGKFAPQHL